MADRVSAQITLGGKLAGSAVPALIAAIEAEGVSTDYEGTQLEAADLFNGEPLTLCASEVAWGTFNVLEAFCRTHGLAYRRWFGACSGVWGAGRCIYRGYRRNPRRPAGHRRLRRERRRSDVAGRAARPTFGIIRSDHRSFRAGQLCCSPARD